MMSRLPIFLFYLFGWVMRAGRGVCHNSREHPGFLAGPPPLEAEGTGQSYAHPGVEGSLKELSV